jgi:HEAT repeat protein/cyclophilin family peptidyl-prolyl cis-trans isomerase
MIHKKPSSGSNGRSCSIRFRPSIADSRFLLLLIVLAAPSCGRIDNEAERSRHQFFAEALKRESRHFLGGDGFFRTNLLTNPDPEIRSSSALTLGRIGSPRGLPWLYEALKEGDAATRAASAFAVGEIEERGYLQEQNLPVDPRANSELIRLLDDPSISVRTRAVEALGKIGSRAESPGILEKLIQFSYRGTPAEREFIGAAVTALARLDEQSACPVIEELTGIDEPDIQWRALDALVRLKSKQSRTLFLNSLKSPDFMVRSYAALGAGITADPGAAKFVLPLLSPRDKTTSNPVPLFTRISALRALAELKNPAAIPAIEAAVSADPVDNDHPGQQTFAAYAAETIGSIGAAEGEKVLLQLLNTKGPASNNALIALAKIHKNNPERFFQIATGSGLTSPSEVRTWARAMAELGGPAAVKELNRILVEAMERTGSWNALALQLHYILDLRLLNDVEELYRMMLPVFEKGTASELETISVVLSSLARIDAPGIQDTLMPFLGSHDGVIIRAALDAYRPGVGTKSPWTPVVQAFTHFKSSGDIATRVEILRHLKPWIHQAPVQEMLFAALKDSDYSVRLISAGLLRGVAAANIMEQPEPSESALTEESCYALAASRNNSTIAQVDTTRGTIEIELFRGDAPLTVAGFITMANRGDFNGRELTCAFPSEVAGADAAATASSARVMRRETNLHPFERGSVGMVLAGRDFDNGRFFISLVPQPFLDGACTCFGHVVSGMQIADRITTADWITQIRIKETKTLFRRR